MPADESPQGVPPARTNMSSVQALSKPAGSGRISAQQSPSAARKTTRAHVTSQMNKAQQAADTKRGLTKNHIAGSASVKSKNNARPAMKIGAVSSQSFITIPEGG